MTPGGDSSKKAWKDIWGCRQDYPTPAASPDADGSTTIYFGPQQPDGVPDGNWVQTDPDKGWFQLLRLYSPLPAFLDITW